MVTKSKGGVSRRRQAWFARRAIVTRRDNHCEVRILSPRAQVAAAGAFVLVLAALAGAAGSAVYGQYRIGTERAALADREARMAGIAGQVESYRGELDDTRVQLERRQNFIEEMIELLPADQLAPDAELSVESGAKPGGEAHGEAVRLEAAGMPARLGQLGTAVPEARRLFAIEKRQLASVEALTRYAERRSARAEQAIRALGLDPRGMVSASPEATGGPLHELFTEADGSIDPRFERMGRSLTRMAALEQGLAHVPQVMPTQMARMTSSFGYRSDPFTGTAALHSGLDFGGRTGDAIHAAADGKVAFVGYRAGYGKTVEISHGSGLMTRYAHMSAWRASPGDEVLAGEVIGAIGSTGRSTGPHLHFEVRIDGRAVNPRPFLENAPALIADLRS